MATNDLMAELQKDSIKLDDDSERKVRKVILKTFFFFKKSTEALPVIPVILFPFALQGCADAFEIA